jgi:hypothetical protein
MLPAPVWLRLWKRAPPFLVSLATGDNGEIRGRVTQDSVAFRQLAGGQHVLTRVLAGCFFLGFSHLPKCPL